MMLRYLSVPVCSLLTLLCAVSPAHPGEVFRYPAKRLGARNELKYIKGVPVLTVAGTPEQMGKAVGELALRPGKRTLHYIHDLLKDRGIGQLWKAFVQGGRGMVRQFPVAYRAEMEAMIKSAGVSRDAVVVGNTFFDLKKILACSAVLLEGDRTSTPGPLLARNLDYPSMGYIHQYSLVTVYHPKGKRSFASVGFPGLVGTLSGMNDAGLTVAVLEVFEVQEGKTSFNVRGIPYAMCYRKVLEECSTIAEAKKLLEKLPRTSTINLAMADRNHVAVLEITPDRVLVRPARKGLCACTNHFLTAPLKAAKLTNVCDTRERLAYLSRLRFRRDRLSPEDLRKELHRVHLGTQTLQTMVFDPVGLQLHLSIGPRPASKGPLTTLKLGPLLKKDKMARKRD